MVGLARGTACSAMSASLHPGYSASRPQLNPVILLQQPTSDPTHDPYPSIIDSIGPRHTASIFHDHQPATGTLRVTRLAPGPPNTHRLSLSLALPDSAPKEARSLPQTPSASLRAFGKCLLAANPARPGPLNAGHQEGCGFESDWTSHLAPGHLQWHYPPQRLVVLTLARTEALNQRPEQARRLPGSKPTFGFSGTSQLPMLSAISRSFLRPSRSLRLAHLTVLLPPSPF